MQEVYLNNEGLGTAEDFTSVFKEDSIKYVDLTNGQKSTTAQLYLTASLLRLSNIYYISLSYSPDKIPSNPILGQDYEYVKLSPFTGISNLSQLSYFDLIFYIEEIQNIFSGIPENCSLYQIRGDLINSITSFFKGNSFRSAVSDATTSSEVLIDVFLYFLNDYPPARQFANDFGVDLDTRNRDPLGVITFFFNQYSKKSSRNRQYIDQNLEAVLTVPGLLTPLRNFRNLAAHAGISSHSFESNEVRICINLALECFRCIKASEEFWKRLLTQ